MRKLLWIAIVGGCLLTAACVQRVLESAPAPSVPAEVPEGFRGIYREIDAEIDRQLPLLPLRWEQKKTSTAFGVELLEASSLQGEALLRESAVQTTARTLDRLKALGIISVSIRLHYPALTRSHPQTAEYREFYRRIAAEIRKRELLIAVEMGSGFQEPEFGQLAVDYRGLTRKKFAEGLREMAEAVIADIRPEFLTILSEPDTQTRNTGLAFSAREFATAVKQVASGLNHPGIKLGAGAGSWTSIDYFKALAGIPELDYLDFHIYPVQFGFSSDRILKAREAARDKGKKVAIGAAWLYKVSAREFNQISPVEAFARDAYSFWQPLDANFIKMVVNLATATDAEFCSFFGTNYLYAYIKYNEETSRLPAGQIMKLSEQAAAENIRKGNLSPTGERLKELIAQ